MSPSLAEVSVQPVKLCSLYSFSISSWSTCRWGRSHLLAKSIQGIGLPSSNVHFESTSFFHLSVLRNEFLFVRSNMMIQPCASL